MTTDRNRFGRGIVRRKAGKQMSESSVPGSARTGTRRSASASAEGSLSSASTVKPIESVWDFPRPPAVERVDPGNA